MKLNLPNSISLARIALVPVMTVVYILNFPYAPLIAVCIFLLAAFTDFLDGHIARKRNIVTDLGKLLDPIADKFLTLFALFLISYSAILKPGWISAIFGAIIMGRELLVSVLRQVAASKNVIIHANIYGKIKTNVQYVALPILMLLNMEAEITALSPTLYTVIYWFGYAAFALATALTLVSGYIYLMQNKGVFAPSDNK